MHFGLALAVTCLVALVVGAITWMLEPDGGPSETRWTGKESGR